MHNRRNSILKKTGYQNPCERIHCIQRRLEDEHHDVTVLSCGDTTCPGTAARQRTRFFGVFFKVGAVGSVGWSIYNIQATQSVFSLCIYFPQWLRWRVQKPVRCRPTNTSASHHHGCHKEPSVRSTVAQWRRVFTVVGAAGVVWKLNGSDVQSGSSCVAPVTPALCDTAFTILTP